MAVVGHVEWVRFARVSHMPRAGEIAHGEDYFDEPAGGGAVAAVQLARLAGRATLVTALGEDELAERSLERLSELHVDVHVARRDQPTRTGVALIDDAGERTITTFGERLAPAAGAGVGAGGDGKGDGRGGGDGDGDVEIDWDALAGMDAIYFTAGDLGALRAARRARVLVATSRAGDALSHGVPLDALVFSGNDQLERRAAETARGAARLMVSTAGAHGGSYSGAEHGTWAGVAPPGRRADSYGCGDSFAAGLTFGLGAGMSTADALALAARCGAWCLTGSGPYGRQLTAAEL
jgi:ribokinase